MSAYQCRVCGSYKHDIGNIMLSCSNLCLQTIGAVLFGFVLLVAITSSAGHRHGYTDEMPKRVLVQHFHEQGMNGEVVTSR